LILCGYCLCILDPEGDYTSLEALPGDHLRGNPGGPLACSRWQLRCTSMSRR
jgi:hypothetical protein